MIDKENDRRGGEGAKEWGEKRHGVKMGRTRGKTWRKGGRKERRGGQGKREKGVEEGRKHSGVVVRRKRGGRG